jgi:hypothetical protein
MVTPYETKDNNNYDNKAKKGVEKKTEVYTNKFRDESNGILYEAVLIDRIPCFMYMDESGNIQMINQVDDLDRIIKPPPKNASLTAKKNLNQCGTKYKL